MSDKISEIIKNPASPNEKSTKVEVLEENDLGVGGGEGEKHHIKFGLKRNHITRDVNLISKRILHYRGSNAPDLLNSYKVARQDGFLSPETVRYAKVGNKDMLLMTDMSEGGKYIVWGFNDRQTEKEHKSFRELNLNDDDIQKIKTQGEIFIDKANKKGRTLQFYYFHLRKEISTGKIELFLLDIDPSFTAPPWRDDYNQKEFGIFFNLLKLDPEKHMDSIRE